MADEQIAKPGYKTTEFWLSAIAVIVSLVLASGSVVETSSAGQIVGFIAAALTSMGYASGRSQVKK